MGKPLEVTTENIITRATIVDLAHQFATGDHVGVYSHIENGRNKRGKNAKVKQGTVVAVGRNYVVVHTGKYQESYDPRELVRIE